MASRATLSLAFVGGLLLVTLYMVVAATGMTSGAGRAPLVVGVPLLLAVVIQLWMDIVSFRNGDRHGATSSGFDRDYTEVLATDEGSETDGPLSAIDAQIEQERSGISFRTAVFLILLLFGLVYLFGIILAALIFIFIAMNRSMHESIRLSLTMSLGTAAVAHVFFIELLGLRLYRGVVPLLPF